MKNKIQVQILQTSSKLINEARSGYYNYYEINDKNVKSVYTPNCGVLEEHPLDQL